MRAVVQRVSEASVRGDGKVYGSIDRGLLVYLGVDRDDGDADVSYLADKVRHLRIFPDESDRMNRDVMQAKGQVLVVSAFTVQADARRGRRPAFESAASQDRAIVLYELFCDALRRLGVPVERGSFGDYMDVESVNAGPICILLESRRLF
jgi:D-tyrosyl-tRNA(Tyr) deacylase